MPARCCGAARSVGAIYVSVPLVPGGRPLEDFLIDAPIPVDVNALGVSPLGMTLIEREGVYHLLDWIGEDSYPNVCDFLEEVRMLGLSRKISRNTDFAKLTPASKIILIHRRAHIENAAEYQGRARMNIDFSARGIHAFPHWCPKNRGDHQDARHDEMCAGLWWEDIEGGVNAVGGDRSINRILPAAKYHGWHKPFGVTPRYQPAIFAAFPVTQLDVIRDSMGNSHEDTYERAAMAQVPCFVVEE